LNPHTLDFTYLFHRDVDNPDFRLVGEGHQIRPVSPVDGPDQSLHDYESARLKQLMGDVEEVLIEENRRLVEALSD
jgi:hypothetical protein